VIAVIDFGMGNLRSVQKALERIGCPTIITDDKKKMADARALVLPGVGAFKDAMENLDRLGLIKVIRSSIAGGKPFLGICLGLQLLFTRGEEFGECIGLDIVPGRVVPFKRQDPAGNLPLKIPHMGWNTVQPSRTSPFFKEGERERYFYFVHSYYVDPEDADVVLTRTEYGGQFVSAIWKDNIVAVQFHPEKSQKEGLAFLKKFRALT